MRRGGLNPTIPQKGVWGGGQARHLLHADAHSKNGAAHQT